MASHAPKSISPEQLRQEVDEIKERGRVRVNQIQGDIDHAVAMREAVARHLEGRR